MQPPATIIKHDSSESPHFTGPHGNNEQLDSIWHSHRPPAHSSNSTRSNISYHAQISSLSPDDLHIPMSFLLYSFIIIYFFLIIGYIGFGMENNHPSRLHLLVHSLCLRHLSPHYSLFISSSRLFSLSSPYPSYPHPCSSSLPFPPSCPAVVFVVLECGV